jgi:hypothetical protein
MAAAASAAAPTAAARRLVERRTEVLPDAVSGDFDGFARVPAAGEVPDISAFGCVGARIGLHVEGHTEKR